MSDIIETTRPASKTEDPGDRIERVRRLRNNPDVQWLLAKIAKSHAQAKADSLKKASNQEARNEALHQFWALDDVVTIIDKEESAASLALQQQNALEAKRRAKEANG